MDTLCIRLLLASRKGSKQRKTIFAHGITGNHKQNFVATGLATHA